MTEIIVLLLRWYVKYIASKDLKKMPGKDLSEKEFLYISSITPLINVDLFVINEFGELLLSWRDDEFCGTGWHIPGGIIRHGETMQERVELTAKREFGITPTFEELPCKITEVFLNQKYRNHFISLLFKGKCAKNYIKTVAKPTHPGDLMWFSSYPGLIYSQAPYEMYLKEYFTKISR